MKKVYVVDLTKEEQAGLLELAGKGEVRARKMNRAHILLLASEGRTDNDIAEALHTSPSTVERTRRRFVEGGLERALNESPRPGGKSASWMGTRKRMWWLWPARNRPKAKNAGVCSFWPTGWWRWEW